MIYKKGKDRATRGEGPAQCSEVRDRGASEPHTNGTEQ